MRTVWLPKDEEAYWRSLPTESLRKMLVAERQRAVRVPAGEYDPNRHAALLRVYRAKKATECAP